MSAPDIRWVQRLQHFDQALNQLKKFIDKGDLNELEEQGLIQAFEYTFELAWNTVKDFFEYQGETQIQGSRDAFRLAFQRGLVENGELWMQMIRSRTLTSHTYQEAIARQIAAEVIHVYYPQFLKLRARLQALQQRLP